MIYIYTLPLIQLIFLFVFLLFKTAGELGWLKFGVKDVGQTTALRGECGRGVRLDRKVFAVIRHSQYRQTRIMRAPNFPYWTGVSRRLRSGGRTKSYFRAGDQVRDARVCKWCVASPSRKFGEASAGGLHNEARPIMNNFKTRQERVSHESFLNVHIIDDRRRRKKKV